MGGDVAGSARVGVVLPNAADPLALLEDDDVLIALALQHHRSADTAEATADDRNGRPAAHTPKPSMPKSPNGSSRSRTASLKPDSAARRTKPWPSSVWRAMPSKKVPSSWVWCRPWA